MSVESTISRAEGEIANGRLWRAKEILGSSVSTYGYSRDIFRELAVVLLRMGDDLEAGKYFLLSIDTPSDTQMDAINIFLARFNNQNYRNLLSKFPVVARIERRDGYPQYLSDLLAELGAPETLFRRGDTYLATSNPAHDRLFLFGCSLIAFCMIGCMIIGAYTILSWLWNAP